MAEVDSNYMDSDKSTSPPKPHRPSLTREERLKRRKRIALRKMMLSFDEPERQPMYRRLLLPPDDGDMSGEDELHCNIQQFKRIVENESGMSMAGKEMQLKKQGSVACRM